jgi:hypothetical protein
VVVTACDDNELSQESSELRNGVFTYYLVEGMAGLADDNSNGWVSGEECWGYAEPRTTDYNPMQHPQLYDGYGSGELDFLEIGTGPDHEPILLNPSVWPTIGIELDTDFEYTVRYYDADGDPPVTGGGTRLYQW